MKRIVTGIGILVALSGSAGYWFGRPALGTATGSQGTAKSQSLVAPAADDISVAEALERIERRLSAVEMMQSATAIQGQVHAVAGSVPAKPTSADDTEEDVAKPVLDSAIDQMAEIAQRLVSEKRDNSWSAASEAKLAEAAKAAAGDSAVSISKLSCLTSVCAIELMVPDLASPQGSEMASFPLRVEGMAGYHTSPPVRQPDGKYKIAYEFFRSGFPMPGLGDEG